MLVTPSVIDHYYHFAAELLLGVWRAYTSLTNDIGPDGTTSLPAPTRAWFIRMTDQTWRDKPRFNPTILWSAFPNIAMLYKDDWLDIARSTGSGSAKAYMFDQAILADRSAAFRGQATGSTQRTFASATRLGDPGRWWWEPVRRQVLRFAGTPEEILDKNLQGYGAIDPAVLDEDYALKQSVATSVQPFEGRPLVTYISRQSSRRRLTAESHTELVKALEKHSQANEWDLLIVEAEKLTKEQQLQLAAKTTVSGVELCRPRWVGTQMKAVGGVLISCFPFSPFLSVLHCIAWRIFITGWLSFSDHAWRSWQWPHPSSLDATHSSISSN